MARGSSVTVCELMIRAVGADLGSKGARGEISANRSHGVEAEGGYAARVYLYLLHKVRMV
jgi:hypothetical protein